MSEEKIEAAFEEWMDAQYPGEYIARLTVWKAAFHAALDAVQAQAESWPPAEQQVIADAIEGVRLSAILPPKE